jgi:hypothetical protein
MRTRLSICRKKARFQSAEEAQRIAEASAPLILSPSKGLRPYRCDRCRKFHLTSRTKGKRVVRPQSAAP